MFKAKPDHIIEEIVEQVIQHQAGLDIDLSPERSDGKPEEKTVDKEKL